MRTLVLLCLPALAWADTPTLTLDSGIPAGTTSERKPLAFSPALKVFLVERSDKRPTGSERTWNFYSSKDMELLGYVTLTTEAGVSTEHVQWLAAPNAEASGALADLASKAREKLVLNAKAPLEPLLAAPWQKLKAAACPLRAVKRAGGFDLMAGTTHAASIDTPLPPADAKRGCSAAQAGAPKCLASAAGDLVVVVPFKQDCGGPIVQQLALRYNPHDVEYLKEMQLGEAALKKNDVPGAWKHLERSLELDALYAPTHVLHACAAAKSGVAFAKGRDELEGILGSEEARQQFLPRIKHDDCFARWRSDPDYTRWIGQFPTRTPIP
jgi:hypothetical protein